MSRRTSPVRRTDRRGWITKVAVVLVVLSGVLASVLVLSPISDAVRAIREPNWQGSAPPPRTEAYYVSPSGNDTDGTSWANAWNTVSAIKWSMVQPGATVFLDGGTSGVTYTSTLVVGRSGTAAAPITVRVSPQPGHSGPVRIFGGRTIPLPYCGQTDYRLQTDQVRTNGIVFDNAANVIIDGGRWDGLAIYGHDGDGVLFNGAESNDTLRNTEVYDNGTAEQDSAGAWSTDAAGIRPRGRHLTFDQVDVHDNGQDAFQSGGPLNDITIQHSWLHFARENPLQPSGSAFNTPCTHQDGLQIYGGGHQSGVDIRDSVLGPGLMEGLMLGDVGANISSVTVSNSLVINGAHNGLIGYAGQTQNNWTIDHVTVFMNTRQDALSWVGNDSTVTTSIFYGGGFYLPRGLAASEGNCLWRTTGRSDPIKGQVADPLFETDVGTFGPRPSLTTQARADFALQPPTPCPGAGSSITSIKVLVATAR
jgi:hypothetical protein